MNNNMILSASGWRKVFAESGNQEDKTTEIGLDNKALCVLIAETFIEYLTNKLNQNTCTIAVGIDTRPTGPQIADAILKTFVHYKINVRYLSISSAPEIMAYSKTLDGFLYISASHNPIGHNGIKFGLNDGGVLPGEEAQILINNFNTKCQADNIIARTSSILNSVTDDSIQNVYSESVIYKKAAVESYSSFIKQIITGSESSVEQNKILEIIKNGIKVNPLAIVCDMNGSSRTLSIDNSFIPLFNIDFLPFNNTPGEIKHAIIPEPENLIYCANEINRLQSEGKQNAVLGYMPDCDGDRGNIVYWNEQSKSSEIIPAQEVFALCVMAESAFDIWNEKSDSQKKGLLSRVKSLPKKHAVCVNCPTSMRIEEIESAFGGTVFRAEVGEANVVNCAREKRAEGYNVRILGEGSNGGNITFPSSVRDPVATIFAIVKLLTILDTKNDDGTIRQGLFHLWCSKSGQEEKYNKFTEHGRMFTLQNILSTLPVYTTTGVSEPRAVLHVKSSDKGHLKTRFQRIFLAQWNKYKDELFNKYGFVSYDAVTTNGTNELTNTSDWNNANGGLKIRFFDCNKKPLAFIWMRPSGTEPVFRVMCDVKGNKPKEEKSLLSWETQMIQTADSINS